MGTKTYESKRRFDRTPEPKPGSRRGPRRHGGSGRARGRSLTFVVHKHAARALHYDLRLELQGVLKSWAVPKGPSLDPSLKRLAVMVEDHPLEYKNFEGVIPEGNYGAGGVIIWDRGSYRHPAARNSEESERLLLDGLRKGDVKLVLDGKKLKGEFALVKTGRDRKSWLLLKKRDKYASTEPLLEKNRSVASGKTLEEISAKNEGKPSGRTGADRIRLREAMEAEYVREAPVRPMPRGIEPMLATLVRKPFDDPDWLFEVKWDGYRALAEIRGRDVALYSRHRISLEHKFAPIVDALRTFKFRAVFDGEVVVVDERGNPDFQMLQDYQKSGKGRLLYYVFDIVHFEGRDLTGLPLARRKELLQRILPPGSKVRFSGHVRKDGVPFFEAAKKRGLEGVMAKDSRSPYVIGRRTRYWLKVKARLTQEAVIAGFTQPRGERKNLGALVLGVYKGTELIFIGHCGSGLGAETLREVRARLNPLIRKKCPFKTEPKTNMPVTWVKPVMVCEVIFHGWTSEGLMRQPVFLRLREDKRAREVVREGSA